MRPPPMSRFTSDAGGALIEEVGAHRAEHRLAQRRVPVQEQHQHVEIEEAAVVRHQQDAVVVLEPLEALEPDRRASCCASRASSSPRRRCAATARSPAARCDAESPSRGTRCARTAATARAAAPPRARRRRWAVLGLSSVGGGSVMGDERIARDTILINRSVNREFLSARPPSCATAPWATPARRWRSSSIDRASRCRSWPCARTPCRAGRGCACAPRSAPR